MSIYGTYFLKAGKPHYGIVENGTHNLIATSSSVMRLEVYEERLREGCGFEGDTPAFFCNPPLNLDELDKHIYYDEEEDDL